ncbi:hypothetical protein BDN67DRAFT_1017523 [Paxillus ammoniavirescens]|nr:hypothetical protein BDN67DRAFT_1017523 [Paxillus ammoniavirescens]
MLNYLERSTSNPPRHATKEMMGTFTTEPDVCQMLHKAHIPVWFIRPQSLLARKMNVHKVVSLVPPTNIVTAIGSFACGQLLQYEANIGPQQFVNPNNLLDDGQNLPQGTNAGGTEVAEGSGSAGPSRTRRTDTIAQGSSSAGPSRTRKTDTHARPYPPPAPGKGKKKTPSQNPVNSNADLWNKPNHEAIPPFIYNWNHALSATNKDPKRVHPNAPKMVHHLPTPTLFMKVSSVKRRTHYLTNWLTMRSAWITRLSVSNPTPIISRRWRDFLNDISKDSMSTSYSTKLKDEAIQLFGPDFLAIRCNKLGPTVGFCDMVLLLKDLVNIDNVTFGKILWDLYKHNFCFELIALDKHVVPNLWPFEDSTHLDEVLKIFPGDVTVTMCLVPFPANNKGLASNEPSEKCGYLENLHLVMSSWLEFPADVSDPIPPSAASERIWSIEKKLALFYCQMFFNYFGCPPIVLHQILTLSHIIYSTATRR